MSAIDNMNPFRQAANGPLRLTLNWTPETVFNSWGSYSFGDSLFRKMEKEWIIGRLLKHVHTNGNSWEVGANKTEFLDQFKKSFGQFGKALKDLIDEGYISEINGTIKVTDKLKDAYVQTAKLRLSGTPYRGEIPQEAINEVLETTTKASSATSASGQSSATPSNIVSSATSERKWYQILTHDAAGKFSGGRAAASAGVAALVVGGAYLLKRNKDEDNWRGRVSEPKGQQAEAAR